MKLLLMSSQIKVAELEFENSHFTPLKKVSVLQISSKAVKYFFTLGHSYDYRSSEFFTVQNSFL